MGSHIGTLKVGAKLLGITFEEYMSKRQAGLKHCSKCKEWKFASAFGKDSTRFDGLDAKCFSCRRVKQKKNTKGRPGYFKGKHHTPESKRKLSEAKKGKHLNKPRKPLTPEQRHNISEGTKKNTPRGPANFRWKGGISPETQKARHSFDYEEWRRQVFERDHFICQRCGYDKGHILVAHHIHGFSEHHQERYDIANGITLCKPCHKFTHAHLGLSSNYGFALI